MFECIWSTQGEVSEIAAKANEKKLFSFFWNLGLNYLEVSSKGVRSGNDFSS